jgi:hypothetical protein
MKPLAELKLKITIVGDSSRKACTANCGVDWSSVETMDSVKREVLERYGHDVSIDYIDLSKAVEIETKRVKSLVDGLTMPVLLVNDRPRITGEFDSRQLMDVIEVDLEIEHEHS